MGDFAKKNSVFVQQTQTKININQYTVIKINWENIKKNQSKTEWSKLHIKSIFELEELEKVILSQ